MPILRLNQKGKNRFLAFLDSQRTSHPQPFPAELLQESQYTELIRGNRLWLDDLELDDALRTAEQLDSIVQKLDLRSAERDSGFWSWCSAYLFDKLCKKDRNSNYIMRESAVWIAEPDNWRRYYRHYLASIWQVFHLHKDKKEELKILLKRPVNTPGELWGQVAANQGHITNPAFLELIYKLFWDKENNRRKHGAGGSGPRRLMRVLSQFELTYDLSSMSCTQIIQLLPPEFDRFKPKQPTT